MHVGLEDEVDVLVRFVDMRRAGRDRQVVLPQQPALARVGVGQVVVLLHHLQDVAVPLHRQVHLARQQQILAVVARNGADIGLGGHEHRLGLGELPGVGAVQRVAEVFQRHLHDGRRLGQPRYAAGVGRVGVEDRAPGIRHALDLGNPVADADGAPEVGHGVDPAGVERRVLEGRVEVDAIGDLGVVQGVQHAGLDHALHEVVGRHDHVIAGVAFAQPGKQL